MESLLEVRIRERDAKDRRRAIMSSGNEQKNEGAGAKGAANGQNTQAANTHKLKFSEKIAYGMGDSAANVYVAMTGSFLTGFYTDTVGLAAAAVGTMMLVTRVFDGITDLLMGGIVEKTHTRWGKARPWVLWTAPFMALGLILLFTVPKSLYGTNGGLIYAYITYIFMNCLVYTANNLPFNALLSRMSLDVQDRADTASVRFIMTQITTLIVNAVTASLVSSVGWVTLAVIYGLIEVVMLLWCFFGCKEHIGEDEESKTVKTEKVPMKVGLKAVLTNKYFYFQALLFLVLYIYVVCIGSSTYYFCNTVLGNLSIMTVISSAMTIAAIISNFIVPYGVRKFGKRICMIAGCILVIIGSAVVGLAGTNIALVVVGQLIRGFGQGPIMSGIFAMTADIVDYGEWKKGIRTEGLVNSATSFGMKVGIGLGSAVCTGILSIGGYVGTAEVQTASAIASIKFAFGYMGVITMVICLILVLLLNLDKYMPQIQKDLKAKHNM